MAHFYSKKVCRFCAEKLDDVDYKDVKLLQRYLNSYGKIETRKRTGTCPKHQRRVAVALKRARHLALLPFVVR
jgi:small subunit ribosomal protein S18